MRLSCESGRRVATNHLKVFVGGIPFSVEEETLREDFGVCGEIDQLVCLKDDRDRFKGIAFITFKTKAGVEAALKYDGDDYGGRTLKVAMASGRGGSQGSSKGGKEEGKAKGRERTRARARARAQIQLTKVKERATEKAKKAKAKVMAKVKVKVKARMERARKANVKPVRRRNLVSK